MFVGNGVKLGASCRAPPSVVGSRLWPMGWGKPVREDWEASRPKEQGPVHVGLEGIAKEYVFGPSCLLLNQHDSLG